MNLSIRSTCFRSSGEIMVSIPDRLKWQKADPMNVAKVKSLRMALGISVNTPSLFEGLEEHFPRILFTSCMNIGLPSLNIECPVTTLQAKPWGRGIIPNQSSHSLSEVESVQHKFPLSSQCNRMPLTTTKRDAVCEIMSGTDRLPAFSTLPRFGRRSMRSTET